MPFLFLSPSTQYFNPYITTGDERYWMNALADEMTPYLHASGITVTRNDPDGSAAQSIRDAGGEALAVEMDVTSEQQVVDGIAKAVATYGQVDVLVSNAGIQIINKITEFKFEDWKKMLAIHLDGAFLR